MTAPSSYPTALAETAAQRQQFRALQDLRFSKWGLSAHEIGEIRSAEILFLNERDFFLLRWISHVLIWVRLPHWSAADALTSLRTMGLVTRRFRLRGPQRYVLTRKGHDWLNQEAERMNT